MAQTSVMYYNNLLVNNNNLLTDYNKRYSNLWQSSIIITYKLNYGDYLQLLCSGWNKF